MAGVTHAILHYYFRTKENLFNKVFEEKARQLAATFLSRVALYEGTWQKFRNNVFRGKELLDIAAKADKKVNDGTRYKLLYTYTLGDYTYK